ncbi:coronin-2A isoform X3 [Hemibagrus wyckioides]|uniref:coronin-2A isoform X3 n=1 Tax=Hemibagrus wyckioides TaxID=337641 RepID=UPI00266D7698|nr:coronin-2A isoform X3 [Hemibagrus wyckioides]
MEMTWRPQYRSSKFRHVFGKAASKENCYDGVPITRSVHDNQLCAVNPRFIAVITECAGGGAFLVLSINHTGKVDPHHPRISGHRGNVLDVKWNPFNDFCIASCSEDATVKVWEIPKHGVMKNITVAWKELQGHSRRVGLIEWHPTASNVLFSTGYDYQVMVWNLNTPEQVIKNPVRSISVHTDVVLSMSFNTDGSLMATSCKDKKIRIIDPRTGTLLQETNTKTHRASKVMFLGNLKMLLSTGNSRWNHRQIALWDQGDGNIRYYEISSEKPYVHYLTEYRSLLPQKGMGVMPKRGLDVCSCEVFRFYRLVTTKSLIEPLSMIVPRRSESYQEDIYPMTAGIEPAMTAEEWLSGMDKGPVLVSLKPGLVTQVELCEDEEPVKVPSVQLDTRRTQTRPGLQQLTFTEHQRNMEEERSEMKKGEKKELNFSETIANGQRDSTLCSPPKTENELLQVYYKQQEEIRRLRELLGQRDVRIKQLELEIKNVRNSC